MSKSPIRSWPVGSNSWIRNLEATVRVSRRLQSGRSGRAGSGRGWSGLSVGSVYVADTGPLFWLFWSPTRDPAPSNSEPLPRPFDIRGATRMSVPQRARVSLPNGSLLRAIGPTVA